MSEKDDLPEITNIKPVTSNDRALPTSSTNSGNQTDSFGDSNYSLTPSRSSRSSDTSKHDPLVGRMLKGTYTLKGKIGEGGMGYVYAAIQAPLDRQVAVKMLKPSESDADGRHYFMREIKAINLLRHPNIVSIVDFGEEPDGTLFLVMEHLPGSTLKRVIRHEFPLDPKRICRICIQILSALEQAHGSGVIHCDLKPGNIMLEEVAGESDFAKILDFGIAKVKGPSVEVGPYTQAGNIVGTFDYMSPEQIMRKDLDGRADVWSLGVILFEMLTRRRIFHDKDAVSIIGRVMQMKIKRPSEIVNPKYNAKIPSVLEEIAFKALQRNIDLRYKDAAAMREAFKSALKQMESGKGASSDTSAGMYLKSSFSLEESSASSSSKTPGSGGIHGSLIKGPSLRQKTGTSMTGVRRFNLGDSQRLATGISAGTSILDQTFSIEELESSLTGERRKVAILAIQQRAQRQKGIDPEEIARRSKAEVSLIREQVQHFGGVVDSFLGGTYTVLFGSKEAKVGDSQRALECAKEIQKRFRSTGSGFQHLGLGLTYGEIYISDKRGGNAFGSPIDFAVEIARGSKNADIYVDEALKEVTQERGVFGKQKQSGGDAVFLLESIQVNSKPDYKKEKLNLNIPRVTYINEITRRFTSVKKKRGGGVAILGAFGVGKTTFLNQALSELKKGGANIFYAPSVQIEAHKSLSLIRIWIREIAKTYSNPTALIEKAAASMGVTKGIASLGPLYLSGKWDKQRAHELPWSDNESFVFFTSSLLHRMIRFAMRQGPVVLCVDDLCDADESTLHVLDALLEAISNQPVLVLVAKTFDAALNNDHHLPGNFEILSIGGFDFEQTRRFIREALGTSPSSEVVERIFDKSGGNPVYLTEMIHQLRTNAHTQMLSEEHLRNLVPLSLRELLAQRVDSLPSNLRDLLAIASVLGESFREGLLYQVAPAHLGPKLGLPELIEMGLLEASYDVFGDVHVAFHPRTLRDVVYARLPNQTKKDFHSSVIDLLEAAPELASADAIDWSMSLAFHYKAAQSYEHAAIYLGRAAEAMLNTYDFPAAIQELNTALDLLREHGFTFENETTSNIFTRLIATSREGGRVELALSLIHEIDFLEQLPAPFWGTFLLEKGRLGGRGISIVDALSALEKSRDISVSKNDILSEIQAMLAMSSLFQEQNQLNHAGTLLIEVAKMVERIPNLDLNDPEQRKLVWTAYNQLGTLFIRQTKINDAQKYLNIALGRAKEIGDVRGIVRVLSNLGALCLTIRDVSTATEYFGRALIFAKSSGDLINQAKILTNLGVSALERNDLQMSKKSLKDAKIIAEEIGWTEGLVDISLHIRRLKAALG